MKLPKFSLSKQQLNNNCINLAYLSFLIVFTIFLQPSGASFILLLLLFPFTFLLVKVCNMDYRNSSIISELQPHAVGGSRPVQGRLGAQARDNGGDQVDRIRAHWDYSLIGFIKDYRKFEVEEIEQVIFENWELQGDVQVIHVASVLFSFHFSNLDDRNDILQAGPWNFQGAVMFLKLWIENMRLVPETFTNMCVWVQIHEVAVDYFGIPTATKLGNIAGTLEEVDQRSMNPDEESFNWDYIRVKVSIDINEPLVAGCFFKQYDGEDVWVWFTYEKLFRVCYKCGRIGHTEAYCDIPEHRLQTFIYNRLRKVKLKNPEVRLMGKNQQVQYNRKIRALRNTEGNRCSKIAVEWRQEEAAIVEVENQLGTRKTFFYRQLPPPLSPSPTPSPV